MSHAHCPACRHAFDLRYHRGCPRCAPRPADAAGPDEVEAALDRLAAALARLDDDERAAVALRLATTERADTWAGVIAAAIAGAVVARHAAGAAPPPLPVAAPTITDEHAAMTPRERALLALALGLLARLAAVTRAARDRLRRR